MARLAKRHRVIAPELRGYGDSDKPDGPFGAPDHAADMLALLDVLGITRAGIIGHDVGGAAMQPLARKAPERVAGLFFFDFVYPGIGSRMGAPDRLNEIWYQSFNQMDMAPAIVGASRQSCQTYISHFLRHWAIAGTRSTTCSPRSRKIFSSPEIWPAALRTTAPRMRAALP